MKIRLTTLRQLIREAMDDDDGDGYELEKRSMVPIPVEKYREIYKRFYHELSPYETFTNPEENSRFGGRHIYTLWGLKDAETPVISLRERDGKHTYLANPKFLEA